jgi:aspartyl-tRNA synthetase
MTIPLNFFLTVPSMSDIESSLPNMRISSITELSALSHDHINKSVTIRGFVMNVKVGKKFSFISLRDQLITVQCIISTTDEIKKLTNESYIEVSGNVSLVSTKIKSCTIDDLEIQLKSFKVLSMSEPVLPFTYKDVSYTREEQDKFGVSPVSYHLCLDNRSLYLRSPQGYSFVRVIDGIMYKFRDHLRQKGFVEIKTPKLIGGASEGGANCFTVDYFKRKATLAQSPQLYKQMCIIGGLKKVYEIGHVYRAEESNINRYLSEFVGLDIEMEMTGDYIQLINFIYDVFKSIFSFLSEEYKAELETIKKYFNYEEFKYLETPLIIEYTECMKLLKEEGIDMNIDDDFNNENEKKLGEIVKKKWSTDIFVIKDYPVSCRPFYTSVNEKGMTNSYDFIVRGEEILSGAQRINNYQELVSNIERCGINVNSLGGYVEAFKLGAPPHGGCGIGLERFVKAYFGMKDIRYFSLFPRDTNRLYP